MRLLITSEEGARAAKAASPMTALVTEVDGDKLFGFLVYADQSDPEFTEVLRRCVRREFERLYGTGEHAAVIFVPPETHLEALSDVTLRKLGLRRVR